MYIYLSHRENVGVQPIQVWPNGVTDFVWGWDKVKH